MIEIDSATAEHLTKSLVRTWSEDKRLAVYQIGDYDLATLDIWESALKEHITRPNLPNPVLILHEFPKSFSVRVAPTLEKKGNSIVQTDVNLTGFIAFSFSGADSVRIALANIVATTQQALTARSHRLTIKVFSDRETALGWLEAQL